MTFGVRFGYNPPIVIKINEHVTMAIYKGRQRKTIVTIVNEKDEEIQEVALFKETLNKLVKKLNNKKLT